MITKANDTVLDLADPPRVSQVDMTDGTVTTNATGGTQIVNYQTMDAALKLAVPAGVVVPWAGSSAPTDWLLCDGGSYSTALYPTLFAAIGYTYGGAGATFNVPDLRGRGVAALDNMGGVSANRVTAPAADTIGGTLGFEEITLSIPELPSHDHSVSANAGSLSAGTSGSSHSHTGSTTGTGAHSHFGWWESPLTTGASGDNKPVQDRAGTRGGGDHTHGIVINPGGTHSHSISGSPGISESPVGSGQAHDNMQPTMFMNYIIKAI